MEFSYPPTIVIRHRGENPKKCSILPLRGREDIRFFLYPPKSLPPLDGYIRLAVDAPPLGLNDAQAGLLLLDCNWRRVALLEVGLPPLPARSLPHFQTAFPRVSKLGTDPDQGLATVEALFLAHWVLGRPTAGLLDHYRWAREFLQRNGLADQGPDNVPPGAP